MSVQDVHLMATNFLSEKFDPFAFSRERITPGEDMPFTFEMLFPLRESLAVS